MCRISAPTLAGAESGRFQQICWSNPAPAALTAGFAGLKNS